MIKIRVYKGDTGYIKFDNSYVPETRYTVIIYLFGIPIHAYTVQMGRDAAELAFGENIEKTEKKIEKDRIKKITKRWFVGSYY